MSPQDKDFNQVGANSVKTGGPTETAITTTIVNSLVDNEPLADDGETYADIQTAENNASGWVFVPPGTFTENIVVDTQNITIVGSGRSTLVDGQTNGEAITISQSDVTIRNLSAKTTDNNNGTNSAIQLTSGSASDCTISGINIRESDKGGITDVDNNPNCVYLNNNIETSFGTAIEPDSDRGIVSGNIIGTVTNQVLILQNEGPAQDCVVSNNVAESFGGDGFRASGGADSIFIANSALSGTGDGLDIFTPNVIVANNRANSLNDSGTGTIRDGNLLG